MRVVKKIKSMSQKAVLSSCLTKKCHISQKKNSAWTVHVHKFWKNIKLNQWHLTSKKAAKMGQLHLFMHQSNPAAHTLPPHHPFHQAEEEVQSITIF